jgi:hypothetical protein
LSPQKNRFVTGDHDGLLGVTANPASNCFSRCFMSLREEESQPYDVIMAAGQRVAILFRTARLSGRRIAARFC